MGFSWYLGKGSDILNFGEKILKFHEKEKESPGTNLKITEYFTDLPHFVLFLHTKYQSTETNSRVKTSFFGFYTTLMYAVCNGHYTYDKR